MIAATALMEGHVSLSYCRITRIWTIPETIGNVIGRIASETADAQMSEPACAYRE
jgi:hypothetical protein